MLVYPQNRSGINPERDEQHNVDQMRNCSIKHEQNDKKYVNLFAILRREVGDLFAILRREVGAGRLIRVIRVEDRVQRCEGV